MQKNLTIILFLILLSTPMYPNDVSQWENCTEGLEGEYTSLFEFENTLYIKSKPYSNSNDNGRTWISGKGYDSAFGYVIYQSKTNIFKYKNVYIAESNFGFLISEDKINWQKMKYTLPVIEESSTSSARLNNVNIITTDSTVVIRCYWDVKPDSSLPYVKKIRTCIANGIGDNIYENFVFDTIPVKNDYTTIESAKYFNYRKIEDTLYSIYYTSKGGYFNWFYYSIDNGYTWQKKLFLEINDGIKEIKKINGKLYFVGSVGLWRPNTEGKYEKIIEDKYQNFNADFLCGHNGMIYAQAIDSHSQKPILVRSADDGDTWDRISDIDYRITQMFSINGELIANSYPYAIIASSDDGETWQERNNGLFTSPDYYYQGPWGKIINQGNEFLTAPRYRLLRNTIMKSYDGGKTWNRKIVIPEVGIPSEYLLADDRYNFTVSTNKYGTFAVDIGNNKTYKTNDFGETWEFYSDGAAFYKDEYQKMYERNDTLFYFWEWFYSQDKYKYIYYSLDTFKNFVMYDSTFKQKLPENTKHLFVKNGIFSVIDNNYDIFQSSNEGKSWEYLSHIDIPANDSTYQAFIFDVSTEKTIMIYKNNKSTTGFYTDDLGKTIKQFYFPEVALSNKLLKMIYLNNSIYALFNTYLYESKDNGSTWKWISEGLNGNEITDILTVDNYLYISTIEGLFRIKVDPVSVEDELDKITILPIELYPNPGLDKIQLANNYYNLKNVEIYDILGNKYKVQDYSNEYFDISILDDGVYIAKLTFDGGWFITRKFIKTKY